MIRPFRIYLRQKLLRYVLLAADQGGKSGLIYPKEQAYVFSQICPFRIYLRHSF
jgi:hypothetical protein